MRNKLGLIALTLFLCQGVFAKNPEPPRPEDCPALSMIKTVGVNQAIKSEKGSGRWVAFSRSSFNTHDNWLFAVELQEDVRNEAQAVVLANNHISQYSLMMGPQKDSTFGWGCVYFSNFSSMGVAITPDDFNPSDLYRFK